MGPVDEGVPELSQYFHKEVAPLIDNKQIRWIGEVGLKEKAKVLGEAKGFLNPIQWEEPFGLVMTEAMATGTPVISFNRGAAPELIVDGKTGFLVETLDEMVAKIADLDTIDRQACRTRIETHFTREKMIDDYVQSYKTTIANWEKYKHQQQALLLKHTRH
jgi:glycosyltransferase involved in cell wall biosynthesis